MRRLGDEFEVRGLTSVTQQPMNRPARRAGSQRLTDASVAQFLMVDKTRKAFNAPLLADWVEEQRDLEAMNNDDTTLVRIDLC